MKVKVTYDQTKEEVKLSFEPSKYPSENSSLLLQLQKQGWAKADERLLLELQKQGLAKPGENVFSSPVSAFTDIQNLEEPLRGYEIEYDRTGGYSKYDKEVDGMLRNSAGASTPEIEARWKETARELLQEYFDNNPSKSLSR